MSLLENNTEPRLKRARQSESEKERNEDRLSALPDDLLLHILKFVNYRAVVQTCILSKRWKDLWKQLPSLILHPSNFRTEKIYSKFLTKVLSLRDRSFALHTLDFQRNGVTQPRFLERIICYAVSHDVQRLSISVNRCDIPQLPSSLFSCQTLTSLKLSISRNCSKESTSFPVSLNLPSLTTLHIQCLAFCASDNYQAEPFSGCKRLSSLVIVWWTLRDAKSLCISSATLSSLALRPPKLYKGYETVLSTPNLCSFDFEGIPIPLLTGSSFHSVEQVRIDADILYVDSMSPLILREWLIQLVNLQSLTVTPNTLQVLFLISGLLEFKLPSLGSLKSLKVKMQPLSLVVAEVLSAGKSRKAKMTHFSCIPDGILDFLLQNSPSAKVAFT